VFVDRERRTASGAQSGEIAERIAGGDRVVLFAEGTSSDGNRVLPFKSALFAAASTNGNGNGGAPTTVQPLAIAYTRLHGLPLGRHYRPLVAWYGDMEAAGHAWQLLKSGPVDVHITIGAPLPLEQLADRKALARHSEAEVRAAFTAMLRNGGIP
jgi:1-acyl-sn-glycerol-3-phosphate acyltransferase